jgi:hypothetical protein
MNRLKSLSRQRCGRREEKRKEEVIFTNFLV